MIFPLIMLLLCAIGGGAVFFYLKIIKPKKKPTQNPSEQSANEFVNVKDIKGSCLFTRDNLCMCFLKITPISIDLFSKNEKLNLTRLLTAELSSTQFPFQFLAVSRPIDISPLISEFMALIPNAEPKQKEIIKKEIADMNTYAISGEVVERQFYISIWDKADDDGQRDLLTRARHLGSNFTECKISCEVLTQQEIVRLCNLVNNPAYIHLEKSDIEPSIPILSM